MAPRPLRAVGWIAAALAAPVLVLWHAALVHRMAGMHLNDLGKLYYDAVAVLAGEAPYLANSATTMDLGGGVTGELLNLASPPMLALALPLGLLTPSGAVAVWLLLSALGAVLASLWTARAGHLALALSGWTALLILAGASFAATTLTLTGQSTLWLLPLVVLGWWAAREERWGAAGAWWGLAAALKPFLLLVLPWLLWRGRTRAALTASVALVGAALGATLVLGLDAWTLWTGALGSVDWHALSMNGSLRGLLSRALDPGGPPHAVLLDAPGLALALWAAGFAAGAVGALWLSIRTPDPDRALALLLVTALVLSPLGWAYYAFLPLPALMAALWREGAAPVPRWILALLVASLALQLFPAPLVGLGSTAAHALTRGSVAAWSLLLAWAATVGLAARRV